MMDMMITLSLRLINPTVQKNNNIEICYLHILVLYEILKEYLVRLRCKSNG